MVWGEWLDYAALPEPKYHKTIEVQANRKYKLGIDVLVDDPLISNSKSWEVTVQNQTIGKCIPSCENTGSSTNDCDQSCQFYNCELQFEQDVISTSGTTLEITLTLDRVTLEGHNQSNCFCDTYSGTCYEGFITFQESEEMKQMKDVAKISLTEIGKKEISIKQSNFPSLLTSILYITTIHNIHFLFHIMFHNMNPTKLL